MYWIDEFEDPHKEKVVPFEELNYHEVIKERLDYRVYTPEQIGLIKDAAYERNYKDGKYECHGDGFGPDCPSTVGMPDCSTTLVYDRANNSWLLTDGLGNGWMR